MAMKGKIRAMHLREGKSISEIARRTSLSRNTIKKWLKEPAEAAPKYRRPAASTKLAPYVATLTQALKADAHRPRHERRSARALFAQLQSSGYDGGYSRLTDFIRAWRQDEGKTVLTNAFVPLKFELGDAFQFDWSEEGLVVGGIYYKVQAAHLKLADLAAVVGPEFMELAPGMRAAGRTPRLHRALHPLDPAAAGAAGGARRWQLRSSPGPAGPT